MKWFCSGIAHVGELYYGLNVYYATNNVHSEHQI